MPRGPVVVALVSLLLLGVGASGARADLVEWPTCPPSPGPDGALWFTAAGSDAIGRVAPGGGPATMFPLPPPAKGFVPVDGIAAGPDGRLWWCGQGSDRVGAITTAGVVSTWKLPKGGGCG